ncbi:MAG: hypothetical protein FWG34_15065 [Oscillospiraceae bacterium]|nr:hypothetical protein [Oscillospiraceae bacterium]
MYEEKSYFCPMEEREMWDAECYDVQMVYCEFMDGKILDFVLDKKKRKVSAPPVRLIN